jgi:hypothetical protein
MATWAERLTTGDTSRAEAFRRAACGDNPTLGLSDIISVGDAADVVRAPRRRMAATLQRGTSAFEPRLSHAERVRGSRNKASAPPCNGPGRYGIWGLRAPARCSTVPAGTNAASKGGRLKLTVVRRTWAGQAAKFRSRANARSHSAMPWAARLVKIWVIPMFKCATALSGASDRAFAAAASAEASRAARSADWSPAPLAMSTDAIQASASMFPGSSAKARSKYPRLRQIFRNQSLVKPS